MLNTEINKKSSLHEDDTQLIVPDDQNIDK